MSNAFAPKRFLSRAGCTSDLERKDLLATTFSRFHFVLLIQLSDFLARAWQQAFLDEGEQCRTEVPLKFGSDSTFSQNGVSGQLRRMLAENWAFAEFSSCLNSENHHF